MPPPLTTTAPPPMCNVYGTAASVIKSGELTGFMLPCLRPRRGPFWTVAACRCCNHKFACVIYSTFFQCEGKKNSLVSPPPTYSTAHFFHNHTLVRFIRSVRSYAAEGASRSKCPIAEGNCP